MEYPPESLKSFCNRVAEAAVAEEGTRFARLLRLAGLLGEPFQPVAGQRVVTADRRREGTAAAEPDGRVGIWERKNENGKTYFVRRMDMLKEWNYWANLGRIEPKGARQRVVLIGESVARGYLYDPLFTPAMALESIFASQLGVDRVEVIDLARTNLGLEVGELAVAALQLEPDVVVIFSGNNWSVSFPPRIGEVAHVDTVLREQAIPGLKRFAEEQLAGRVRDLVRNVSARYIAEGVPLVWIVPEFNLGDWRDPITNAPHLPGTANRDWIESWQGARQALEAGDLARAAELAQRMVELDQGVTVAGLYVLAECSRHAGDREATRHYLELARDAVLWDPSRSTSPRTYAVVQEVLKREAAGYGCELVDMPHVFREYLDGDIPDRRLFIDYCHLTSEGIRVAMAAAAVPVLRALTGTQVRWQELIDAQTTPSREVEAEAAFLAAVHNAHWWQSYNLVHHYCRKAVQASPGIAGVMTRFLDFQTRQTPMLMCRATEEISGLGSPLIQHYLLRYNHQQLDRLLLDAVASALAEIGIDTGETLARLRREEHSVRRGETNLLDYYYCSAGLQPQEVMWVVPQREGDVRRKENHFYKAYWINSRFVFVGEAGRPVRLHLACRLPGSASADGLIVVEINGQPQAEIAIGHDWQTWDLSAPGEAVREGLNEIAIHWPMPEFPGLKALETVADDLIDGLFPELFCSFGEIHTFTISDSPAAATDAPAVEPSSAVVGVWGRMASDEDRAGTPDQWLRK